MYLSLDSTPEKVAQVQQRLSLLKPVMVIVLVITIATKTAAFIALEQIKGPEEACNPVTILLLIGMLQCAFVLSVVGELECLCLLLAIGSVISAVAHVVGAMAGDEWSSVNQVVLTGIGAVISIMIVRDIATLRHAQRTPILVV